jgi:type II secretory pathway pseudopilin PulG
MMVAQPNLTTRGFTLLEMTIIVALLAVFSLMASRLFMSTVKTATQASETESAMSRFDLILDQLRRDVWNAQSMTVTGDRALTIENQQTTITWASPRGAGALVRTVATASGDKNEYRFKNVAPDVTFSAEGASVIVAVTEADKHAQARMVLQKQWLEAVNR